LKFRRLFVLQCDEAANLLRDDKYASHYSVEPAPSVHVLEDKHEAFLLERVDENQVDDQSRKVQPE